MVLPNTTVGGWLSDFQALVTLEIRLRREVMPMLTIEGFIAIIGLVLTAFGLGYMMGQSQKQK